MAILTKSAMTCLQLRCPDKTREIVKANYMYTTYLGQDGPSVWVAPLSPSFCCLNLKLSL